MDSAYFLEIQKATFENNSCLAILIKRPFILRFYQLPHSKQSNL